MINNLLADGGGGGSYILPNPCTLHAQSDQRKISFMIIISAVSIKLMYSYLLFLLMNENENYMKMLDYNFQQYTSMAV